MKILNLAVMLAAVISALKIDKVNGDCCNFEMDSCNWGSTDWLRSATELPNPPPPYPGGVYMWATTNGAKLQSILFNIVPAESTVFTFAYFVSGESGLDELLVSFAEIDSSLENVQTILTNTVDGWHLATVDCSPKPTFGSSGCCASYPCHGNFVLTASTTGSALFAVDDIGFNGECGNSLPCCHFDDTFTCGFNNIPGTKVKWHSSEESKPDYDMIPYFTENSGYIWFQTYDGNGTTTFRSPLLNISSTEEITSRIYAYTNNDTNGNRIEIRFYNIETNIDRLLDYAISLYNNWSTMVVNCLSPHGSCCNEQPTCKGYLEYVANVVDGEAFYAVDFASFSSCSVPQIAKIDHV